MGRTKIILAVTCLLMLMALAIIAIPYFLVEEYHRYESPDGRHALVVFRRPLWFAMPGGGSDAPGYVILVGVDGRTLRRQEVDMVQLVHSPAWTANRVSVKLILDWPR